MRLSEIKNIYGTPLMEAVQLAGFRNNIQTMLDRKNFLYRGMKQHSGMVDAGIPDTYAYIITPREEPRTAKGSALGAAIAEDWKDLPARNKSSYATSNEAAARRFGSTYLIVPADSANYTTGYGVGSEDFNFTPGVKSLHAINDEAIDLYYDIMDWIKHTEYTGEELTVIKKLGDVVPFDDHSHQARPVFNDPRTIAFYQYLIDHLLDIADVEGSDVSEESIRGVTIMQRSLSKFGLDKFVDLFDHFTPEDFGITHAKTLADVPDDVGEVWWDKPYLAIELTNETPEDALQVALNTLKDNK